MTSVELKRLQITNRISLLESRSGKENHNIVRKLKRELRNL